MINLLTQCKYTYLNQIATDTDNLVESTQTPELSYSCEPLDFQDAPEDTMLIVVSDLLSGCGIISKTIYKDMLLKGSILVKLSHNTSLALLPQTLKYLTPYNGLIYSDISYFSSTVETRKEPLESINAYIGKFSKLFAKGKVVPITEALLNNQPLVDSNFKVDIRELVYSPVN